MTRLQPRPAWWQGPTVLSLDAPAVTMVWLALVARSGHLVVHWPPFFVLGCSVWLAYAADRWIEGWRLVSGHVRTQRHLFYQRWRWPVLRVWLVVLFGSLGVAFTRLPGLQLLTGLALTLAVLLYVLSHQFVHRAARWRVPKEICIAGLLSAGVAVFLIGQTRIRGIAVPLTLFGGACFMNCASISRLSARCI